MPDENLASAYRVEVRRFPLVVVSPTAAVNDEKALDETYRQLGHVLERDTRFGLLFDMRGGASSPRRRRRFVEWSQAYDRDIKRLVVGVAIILSTEIERGIVTAVYWIRQPSVPTRVFTSERDAETWLLELLASPAPT